MCILKLCRLMTESLQISGKKKLPCKIEFFFRDDPSVSTRVNSINLFTPILNEFLNTLKSDICKILSTVREKNDN